MRVKLDGVGHRFGSGPWLFRGLNGEFAAGEMWAVTGPSGSGKSTLLELLAGWSTPEEGRISHPEGLRASWVAQNPFGVAGRTVLDHVVLALLAGGKARPAAVPAAREVLRRFGVDHLEGQRFKTLSGGEAQRLMLARAAVSATQLLLVDEPTAQLDATSARDVIANLTELASKSRIVVIATHDPRVWEACGRRLDLAA